MDVVAAALGLGSITNVALVKPGSRPVHRLETTAGTFHVKRWSAPVPAWLAKSLEGCAEIERAALAAGVDMPAPVALVHPIGEDLFTVHEWVHARELRAGDDAAAWLGSTLARLHTIPAPSDAPAGALTGAYGLHPIDEWSDWIAQARAMSLPWADLAAVSMSGVEDANAVVRGTLEAGLPVVGSHRDLPGENVLVTSDGFVLVDWDYAGPQLAWPEAVWAAIDLGRLAAGSGTDKAELPDRAVVRAVLDAYLRAGGTRAPAATSLAAVFGTSLARIAWWMWVSLGHRATTGDERRIATESIEPALANLVGRLARRAELVDVVTSRRP